MVATWSPAAASGYYTQQSEYYAGGPDQRGIWFAPTGDFGVADASSVDPSRFEQLFNGLGTDGRLLRTSGGRVMDRVPAFDFTLSAPRSVSLLWAFSNAATKLAIEEAQARAVRSTLAMLEREAAYARRGRGGASVESVGLTAACFQHGESRPAEHADGWVFADPNLHTHAVILNLATRADGTVGALHSTVLRDYKMAAGAVYHMSLASELRGLGFAIDRIGRNGIFEIAGIDQGLIAYFSARRAQIEAELAQVGTTSAQSAALAAAVTKSNREHKVAHVGDQRAFWREIATGAGFDIDRIERGAREESERQSSLSHEATKVLLSKLPEELTRTASVVERPELIRAVAAALVSSHDASTDVLGEIAGLRDRGKVVQIGEDAIGQPRYSTPAMIALEREIVTIAAGLAEDSWRQVERAAIAEHGQKRGLSDEQLAAATATVVGRIAVLEGAPGAGKTTCLLPIVEAHKAAGCRVVGAATAWRVAKLLRDELAIEAKATAAWLAAAERGEAFLDERTLLVIDEAGLLSSREMHVLLKTVEKAGAKVLLVGDRKQLQPIGAGPALSIVTRATVANPVDTIVRQRQAWARKAVTAFGQGDALPALAAFLEQNAIVEAVGPIAAVRALVDANEQAKAVAPTATALMIAKSNAEVGAICREVRTRLIERGIIRGPQLSIPAVTPSGHSSSLMLAAGDKVRFLIRNDRLGVINGTLATIISVSEAPNKSSQPRIQAVVDGRSIEFSPAEIADAEGRARISWGYATTIFGAQGLTVDHADVLVTPAFNRHDIYVAASRARGDTRLVVDRDAVDQQIQAARQGSTTLSRRERLEWLASRLSRSGAKESTLDAIEGVCSPRVPVAANGKQRAAEVSLEV